MAKRKGLHQQLRELHKSMTEAVRFVRDTYGAEGVRIAQQLGAANHHLRSALQHAERNMPEEEGGDGADSATTARKPEVHRGHGDSKPDAK